MSQFVKELVVANGLIQVGIASTVAPPVASLAAPSNAGALWLSTADNRIYVDSGAAMLGVAMLTSNNIFTGTITLNSSSVGAIPLTIKALSGQTADLQQWQDSSGSVLARTRADGSWQPPSIADASAVNNSTYFSTTSSKFTYKDSGGNLSTMGGGGAVSPLVLTAHTPTEIPLTINGAAGQTADLLDVNGVSTFTLTSTASANLNTLTVNNVVNPAADASSNGYTCINVNIAPQSTYPIQNIYGVNLTVWGSNKAKVSSTAAGVFHSGVSDTSFAPGAIQADNIFGFQVGSTHGGSGMATNVFGVQASAYLSGPVGSTAGNVHAMYAQVSAGGSTTATNCYGVYVAAIAGAPANIANRYGMYVGSQGAGGQGVTIADQGAGSTALHILPQTTHAIAVDGGDSVFKAGNATTVPITIQGAASQTADLQEWQDSTGAVLARTRPDGSWMPPSIADTAAVNNSWYLSATTGKMTYKDSTGGLHPLA